MRLNCLVCSAQLDLNDNLAKKLVRCPKCEQSFVVPEIAPPLIAAKPNLKVAPEPDEYELSSSKEEDANDAPVDPGTLKFCPGCGAPWKKDARECKKCHFVPALGARLKPKEKPKRDLRVDLQKFYLLISLAAAGCGIYFLYTHWNSVKESINSIWPHG